ncbi:MAG TPA: hypothetical protein PKL87_08370 [Thermotogota bacterium]|nr:MAG: hypothetical protein BWX67_01537 [Thermotogota bacterium ADurb.Bin062]HOD91681.1 hypothetical protein [Thermotogota bacterium]
MVRPYVAILNQRPQGVKMHKQEPHTIKPEPIEGGHVPEVIPECPLALFDRQYAIRLRSIELLSNVVE